VQLRRLNRRFAPLLTIALLAATAATVGGCGSGADCIDALQFDGMRYAELADDPSFTDDQAEANIIRVDLAELTTLAMVVASNDGCESGDLDDGAATTLPVGTEVFLVPDSDRLAAIVDGEAIVFNPRPDLQD
jgi:hypothetical protein